MITTDGTIRLTTAQAIIRWLASQYIEINGQEMRVCGGGFGIFGHGNVTCIGGALNRDPDRFDRVRILKETHDPLVAATRTVLQSFKGV